MRAPVRPRQNGLKFNITPLIDVVFLLVIFFLVASHFARTDPTETVELPRASQTKEEDDPRRLTVTINAAGQYFVNAKEVSISDLENIIQEGSEGDPETYAVRIRGDQSSPFSAAEPIMLICPKFGVTRFGFHVIEEGE